MRTWSTALKWNLFDYLLRLLRLFIWWKVIVEDWGGVQHWQGGWWRANSSSQVAIFNHVHLFSSNYLITPESSHSISVKPVYCSDKVTGSWCKDQAGQATGSRSRQTHTILGFLCCYVCLKESSNHSHRVPQAGPSSSSADKRDLPLQPRRRPGGEDWPLKREARSCAGHGNLKVVSRMWIYMTLHLTSKYFFCDKIGLNDNDDLHNVRWTEWESSPYNLLSRTILTRCFLISVIISTMIRCSYHFIPHPLIATRCLLSSLITT